ncbi:MAG TPA: betaine/proline/choline family ABC transporter ATP-binding protein [Clostridiales bacterium]|nr:betaine/proline/choline family ABC transporter ATP-binding protein [Clostridiales bacterium]
MIKLEDISKNFRKNKVLKNVSFEIEKGDFVVLIGPSGCGKTTTLKMINRLITPTSGRITIEDKDISKIDPIKLRRNIGYVIQQTGLFPHMTIKENIELIPKVEGFEEDKIKERTEALIELVGLDTSYLDRYPSELSGGQQQRVGVARAFALDPDIILMDEPFSAVDPITRTVLQDELIRLQAKVKKTIVFVTHDIREAIKLADKVCLMNEGQIVQYDTPENILKNPANDFVTEFVGDNRIWQSPEYIRAKDIMINDPVTCPVDCTINEAMYLMGLEQVNTLMAIDSETNRLQGVLRKKHVQHAKNRDIRDIIISDYIYANPNESIVDVLKKIDKYDISNIPVVDNKRKLKGLITKSSLVETLSQQYIDDMTEVY